MARLRPWASVLGRFHPARTIALSFGALIALGTAVLALPVSSEDGTGTSLVTALFTATSAVCVTGLAVVDTPGHWSTFGEVAILALIQVGGFGIMTLASLLAQLVAGKLRLRLTLNTQAETKSLGIGDLRRTLARIAVVTVAVEAVTALVLTVRYMTAYGDSLATATYHGVFHAVSAFNNAGFSLNSDSLVGYAGDPWILLPICAAVILGGLGFPVIVEALRHRAVQRTTGRRGWSLHLRLTLLATVVLLVVGTLAVAVLEWRNPATLGAMPTDEKLMNAFVQSTMSRTAGFNAVDIGALGQATLLVTCVLMFIGGGSAGTAGGIKVTTFAVLAAAIWAEVRGERAAVIFQRTLSAAVIRQALTVALLGVGLVVSATTALLVMADEAFEAVMFEVVSAFGTVGLSTGLTTDLPPGGDLVLIGLMFVGRLGPITLASALALRERPQRYQYPQERPIIG
ncbi:potassium uptake TrkH family protein [Mumia flava]|uniref:Potassium uptake TrkH family protein n=1 Tax=Mumia flava TaxID=1348852 RepID=A0A2M9B649_9ACTN|nr:potassium transporter TrkG [Mumia flava]PJJ53415.1 potassium uptake TrkH family protein [Mumia flava]